MSKEELVTLLHMQTSVINITLSRDDLFEFANMLINADFKKAWLTAQEITEVFGIPYANVKSAQWRKDSKFPSHQPGAYCRPMFHAKEVSAWLRRQ